MLLLPLLVAGCVSGKVEEQLKESSLAREKEFRELLAEVRTQPQRRVSWRDAHQRMQAENLGLQQSRKLLADSERLTRRQWFTLVPRTSAFLNISQDIATLSDFESDDLTASVMASFNIPNPFEFHAQLYGAALEKQSARWSNELDGRRAFAELYSAFIEADTLREEEALMEERMKALMAGDMTDFSKSLGAMANEADALKRRRMMHRMNVNRLLNTPGGNWELSGPPPDISYRKRFRSLKIGPDFGKLALNLYAVRIESAILAKERVKFRQWPSLTFGMSNPPLYSTSGGSTFSGEDFILFSGVSKTVDMEDIGGRESIRDAEFRLKATRGQLRQTMEREAARMVQIGMAYERLLQRERAARAALGRLGRQATAEPEAVLADLELRSQLRMELIQTRREIEQLDLQYLIWDERFWK